jgi:hypothetical protein
LRRASLVLAAVVAAVLLALGGGSAGGQVGAHARAAATGPILGVTGSVSRFSAETGQQSLVDQGFLGWGQGQAWGGQFPILLKSLGPIPMLHLGTKGQGGSEAISPGDIAAGKGDSYLTALNHAIAVWGKGIYVRPMAEMNNYENYYSAYTSSGAAKDAAHSTQSYKQAFRRIYIILHGGTEVSIDAKLKLLNMPPLNGGDQQENPFPRLRILWSPLAGGNPRVAGNAPAQYYPGQQYVDVEGGDIYDEGSAPWTELEALASASATRHEPFSVPEWGLNGIDDPAFVRKMCSFFTAHPSTEVSVFYESRSGSPYDLGSKPQSRQAYHDCVVPMGAPSPSWAAGSAGGLVSPLSLTPTPDSGPPPLSVKLAIQAKLTTPIQHWELLFGDGSWKTGSAAPPAIVSHTYLKPGVYEAVLAVFDAPPFDLTDAQFLVNATVTVGTGSTPALSFVPTPTHGPVPLKVSFKTDLSLPAPPTTWTLVYGDGNTREGTGVPPHFMGHTYTSAGPIQVLFVLNAGGGRTYASTVAINPPSSSGGGPPSTTTTTTTSTPPQPGPPIPATKTGTVLVNGVPFTGTTVPYNVPVDVTNGRLTLRADTGTVTVYGAGVTATFVISRGTDQGRPIIIFTLTKGDFSVCKRKKASASLAENSRTVRSLWGSGKGNFRTKGRYAAATVRGTIWLTADRCDGTFVKVNQGVVQVTSKRRPVLLRAPHSQNFPP